MNSIADLPVSDLAHGGPLELALDLIDEDPQQPRTKNNPGFTVKSLTELAASIRLRGVKTPISVRSNPAAPGRYLINHGARRFRSCRIAGKRTIPAFVDDDYSQADQVVENLHRNELTPREIADYIGRQLAAGMRKGEIARSISKSPAFVTQYVTLLDLPEPIAHAFNIGLVKDVTIVNELVLIYKRTPEPVAGWLADDTHDITRATVRMLREFLEQKTANAAPYDEQPPAFEDGDGVSIPATASQLAETSGPEPWSNPVLLVEHCGRQGRLMIRRRPTARGRAWVRFDDGELADVLLAELAAVELATG